MRPVQLPCSLGRFWDKAERVRHRGRGRILSLTPCSSFPGPRHLPRLGWAQPEGTGRPQESPHQSQSDTTPADLPPTAGPTPRQQPSPEPRVALGYSLCTHSAPAAPLRAKHLFFFGSLVYPIQMELFWDSSAEPRVTGPGVGWGARTTPGPPVLLISAAVMGSNAIFPGGCHGSPREVTK